MKCIRRLAGLLIIAAISCSAAAQETWPTKPVRLIIPSTPGGGTDFIARTLSAKLTEAGWTVVPENRPGAAGTVGLGETVRSKADGYVLVIGQTANVALAPWLMKLSFDPVKDLTPVAWAVEAPMVLLVNENSPFKTWGDFLKAAKAKPDEPMSFATSGAGSVAQVAGELVQEASGFKLRHVPYKGSAPAIADLMGGHVDLAGTSLASAIPLVKGGKVRALAVTSLKRSAALPEVPALSELGYPNFNQVEWYGVFAPARIPPALADRINAEVNKVLQQPEVQRAIVGQGQEPRVESRSAFADMVRSSSKTSHDVITKSGITLE